MNQVVDPTGLIDLLEADRETHLYALGDLEEPYWSNSVWFRDDHVAAGIISTDDDWSTGYAMSRVAPAETLALFRDLESHLPSHSWVTGATGLYEAVRSVRECRTIGPHWRMILDEIQTVDHDFDVTDLGLADLDAMNRLHAAEPRGAFWRVGMLAANPFVGIWEDDRLVASAGCHIASDLHGVAAVGAVYVAPTQRGRGLGTVVTSELINRLQGRFETIGLNVEVANQPALRVYDRLGFRRIFQYEEIELL